MKTSRIPAIILVTILIFQAGLFANFQFAVAEKPNKVIIFVSPNLLSGIQKNLNRYTNDINQFGYSPIIVSQQWNNPEEVRNHLADQYSKGLVGIVIIGDLPVAWYEEEVPEDFLTDPDEPEMEEFPIDLFYMDLDGIWLDTDGNDIYDNHTGNTSPEIWVGRITATTLSGSPVDLTNRYLEKLHDYRTGKYTPSGRALLYVDDDWVLWADSWENDLSHLYGDVTTIRSLTRTNGDDYKNQLTKDFEWLHVAVHSNEYAHGFKVMKV